MSSYELEDYVLCNSINNIEFNDLLKDLIDRGFAPCGQFCFAIIKNIHGGEEIRYMQPMGKFKKYEEPKQEPLDYPMTKRNEAG